MRWTKTVNGTTTTHIWVNNQIVADVTDTYTAICYVRGTNLLAQYEFSYSASDDYTFYLQNAHGDVTALTNTNGEITKSYVYDAFGVEQNISNSDINAFRYCGEYYDSETGTVYLRARYYDASIGRFISRDSFMGKHEDPLSLNLYTYCGNNPIIAVDPSGHVFMLVTAAIGAVAGAVIGGVVAAKNGESIVGGALKGAAVGGLIGLGAGAVAAGALAGSFAASTAAVAVGANALGATVATGGVAAGAGLMMGNFTNAINQAGQTLSNTFTQIASKFQKPVPQSNVYYQVTSTQGAQSIQETGQLVPSSVEQSVCVLNYQPTLSQAKSIGAQSYDTVVRFTSNCSTFIQDQTVGNGAFRNMVDGKVNVSNVAEVGFKTFWDIFKK